MALRQFYIAPPTRRQNKAHAFDRMGFWDFVSGTPGQSFIGFTAVGVLHNHL